jgi:predicted GNAT family N-acyltransferase
MIIRHPNQADWSKFSALAAGESWRVPQSELRLFQGTWSKYAYVLEDDGFCGFVTAVAYEKSAWIGNLIVPQNKRGKGYGSHLFNAVLAGLVEQGMASIWLTASEQGQGIYEREGFRAVDCIERWVLPPRHDVSDPSELLIHDSYDEMLRVDAQVWGESRLSLLLALYDTGKIFSTGNSVALVQKNPGQQSIGPWYSREAGLSTNRDLLQEMIASSDSSVEIVIDCLSSSKLQSLYSSFGFDCCGQTTLMALGDTGDVFLNNMVSLASLGSIG